MKTYITTPVKYLFVLLAVCFTTITNAQNSKEEKEEAKKNAVKKMITDQRYAFRAQSAQPMSGNTRQLTSEYDLTVTKEKITSYLPYFGRAYAAPINPSQGGIQFDAATFEYNLTDRKKGGWDVLIKPKETPEVQQLALTISEDGYATLQVTSTNRQPISFSGYITEIKEKKAK